jgi:hypothetical protein
VLLGRARVVADAASVVLITRGDDDDNDDKAKEQRTDDTRSALAKDLSGHITCKSARPDWLSIIAPNQSSASTSAIPVL